MREESMSTHTASRFVNKYLDRIICTVFSTNHKGTKAQRRTRNAFVSLCRCGEKYAIHIVRVLTGKNSAALG